MKVSLHFYAVSMTTSGKKPNLTAKKTKPFVPKPAQYDIARVEQGDCEPYLMHDIELKAKGHIHFSYHTGGRKHKGLWISPLSFPLQDMCPLCPVLAQETLQYSPCACLPPQHYLQLLAEFPYVYLSRYLSVPLKCSHTHCLLSKRQFLARVHKTQPATHHRYTQMTKDCSLFFSKDTIRNFHDFSCVGHLLCVPTSIL